MIQEPRWIELEVVLAIHESQLSRFGGSAGIRDQGLLESALARPKQHFHYGGETSIPRLAAAYCYGIAKNHAFIDGNKRVAFLTAYTFLRDNGYQMTAEQTDVVLTILRLAAGELTEEDLIAWIESNSRPTAP